MQTSKILQLVSLFMLLAILATSCVSDVNGSKKYPTDYSVGQVYRLRQPVFSDEFFLLPLNGRGGIPKSVEEYKAKGQTFWSTYYHNSCLLEAGTRLQIKRVELEKNPEMGNIVYVRVEVLDGDFKGRITELNFISKDFYQRKPSATIYTVNTNFLERIGN